MTEPIRLAKRLAEMLACSRREAEQYIAGGFVRVDGVVIEEPQFRVQDQKIDVSPDASLLAAMPVTILLHKPADVEAGLGALRGAASAAGLLVPGNLWKDDRSELSPLKKHFADQVLVTPLAPRANGLVVFTQDWRVARKLSEDANVMENEVLVEVSGEIKAGGLERLNRVDHGYTFNGILLGAAKVSWQSEKRLRFALKGERPGQIAFLCESVGLQVEGMKRIRIGRVAMSSLPVGQWRYLLPHEKF
ncbi:MAG: rRNA pseudouridine synthase [Polaromonas sp.]|jgi:23S rRNA pseudouridine2604 synthase|nr:rRNA pseudouridine synthase [Polaromonas sp.]